MISSKKLSWHRARLECLNLEGDYDLAIVDSLQVFEFLDSYQIGKYLEKQDLYGIVDMPQYWIGLYSRPDKKEFKWVDGTKVEFGKIGNQKPWHEDSPNVTFLFTVFI